MQTPIQAHIGAVFVPVRDIAAARNWYCDLLGLEPSGPIEFGHLYVVPMASGSGLVLDSKNFSAARDGKPLFHFMTSDLAASLAWLQAKGIEHQGIQDGVFINFRDPDGNLLMVADVPLSPTPV